MYQKITVVIFLLTLFCCSTDYQIQSNVDLAKITQYFSPSQVTIYESEEDIKAVYQFIGAVEGESCQSQPHHQQIDEVTARTNARKNAYLLKANAIVFSGCALITGDKADKYCISSYICYGRAFREETTRE